MTAELKHYGILRKSGRYPWGSGSTPYQRSMTFYSIVNDLKSKGISEKEIAKILSPGDDEKDRLTVADLRDTKTIAKEQIVREQTARAVQLRAKGVSIQKISEDLGIPQPTVRLRLKNSENIRQSQLTNTADIIRKNVDEHQIVDIGKGTNLNIATDKKLGVSPEKLRAAVSILREEGYEVYNLPVRNPGTKNFTNQQVIVPPGTGFGNARRMTDKIHTMGEWTENEGKTYFGIHDPMSISSKRVEVKFESPEDGTVYVRRGVKDLDMGKNVYAQVRIMIDGTHYIKGMAVLRDDLPPGVDLQVHSNKKASVGKMGALKPKENDPDNPFGAVIKRQLVDIDPKTGKERLKSALNIVNEEGDWDDWRKSLPSQMLAKQPHSLIRSQLDETINQTRSRLDEINRITNPVVKRRALEKYADEIDSNAVDLRAAAMPHQRTQVIIPMPKMNKQEIYAPQFETGERLVLIRYPHGGRFEIPEVVVNNNNRTAKKILGNARDAIGIHPAVASRLSGADFDGDTVIAIPNRSGRIKGAQSMGSQARIFDDGLSKFDPKREYGGFVKTGVDKDGNDVGNFKLMKNTGHEMGKITNLITDMSIQGAKPEHILRAVKHSMVVIDAEKHQLDYKRSEQQNGISQLKTLYQGGSKSGASTLLSQATAKVRIPERKIAPRPLGPIDETGAKVYVPTGRMRSVYDKKTKTYLPQKVPREQTEKRLSLTPDAYSLVRDRSDPVERLYADHTNAMKALANSARLQASRIPSPQQNPKAKAVYRSEVDKLVSDLRTAEKQKPLDRRANVIAGSIIKAKRKEDPMLSEDPDKLAKVERQAKTYARAKLNLKKPVIDISDRQWDAIQSGAVSASTLRKILDYADEKRVSELSMPRTNTVMTSAVSARAKAMLAAGATNADVARALGIPVSTLRSAALRGEL